MVGASAARNFETLRAALLETQGPQLDEAESDPGAWPLDRHYVFGSLFIDHLADRGMDGHARPPGCATREARIDLRVDQALAILRWQEPVAGMERLDRG